MTCPNCCGSGRTRMGLCGTCDGHGSFDYRLDIDPQKADRDMVRKLCEVQEGLSDWEVEFADSLGRRIKALGRDWKGLTVKQRDKARQILARVESLHGR